MFNYLRGCINFSFGIQKQNQSTKADFRLLIFRFSQNVKKLIGKLKPCACIDCENKNKLKISIFSISIRNYVNVSA